MGVSDMRYTLLMILAAFAISGCNIDPQQLARASCALTQECYAPGVTPGTNPYRKTQSSSSSVSTKSLFQSRKTQYSFVISWSKLCPPTYIDNTKLIGHTKVQGKKVCNYG